MRKLRKVYTGTGVMDIIRCKSAQNKVAVRALSVGIPKVCLLMPVFFVCLFVFLIFFALFRATLELGGEKKKGFLNSFDG